MHASERDDRARRAVALRRGSRTRRYDILPFVELPNAALEVALFSEEVLDSAVEGGELVPDDIPENGHVDAEVLMNQDVAEARDLLPLDVRAARSELQR